MKRYLRKAYSYMTLLGIDPLRTLGTLYSLPWYIHDLRDFRNREGLSGKMFPMGRLNPCLSDRSSESGAASGHYFHQDLLVARKIHLGNPDLHVDAGSRIDGFVAHVAAFRRLEVLDIRPQQNNIPNVKFVQVDLMGELPESLIDYCDSLSCLHALEHFGLGRYGDPIDPDGHLTGLSNLRRILKKSGKCYLSVPIGPQRVEFNAHRVFSVKYLLGLFSDNFEVNSFSYVDDPGNLHEDVDLRAPDVDANFGCSYGCGIFEMTKL